MCTVCLIIVNCEGFFSTQLLQSQSVLLLYTHVQTLREQNNYKSNALASALDFIFI